jgi:hypothetical protein
MVNNWFKIPAGAGTVGSPLTVGFRMMIRPQLGRGQAIRLDDTLQIRRQLQGQRTNFLPVFKNRY